MKVLLLADVNSIHTIKWANNLSIAEGIEIGIWSIVGLTEDKAALLHPKVKIFSPNGTQTRKNFLTKLKYLSFLSEAKNAIKKFNPDILHAHYATSYGLIGRLIGFKPLIISVWGSDVYLFPRKNFFFKKILVDNLKSANIILSTSKAMGEETKKYTKKEIFITPFGIDTKRFSPNKVLNRITFNIGCIKSLEEIYGIRYLILAFARFLKEYPEVNSKLLIGGEGSEGTNLRDLANELNITDFVEFIGRISNDAVPQFLNDLDVAVFPSLSESFGVAAIEASSVEVPVIVSNVGGLPEVIDQHETGIIVEPKDIDGLFKAIEYLYENPLERMRLGKNGRQKVCDEYEITENTQRMIDIYSELLKK